MGDAIRGLEPADGLACFCGWRFCSKGGIEIAENCPELCFIEERGFLREVEQIFWNLDLLTIYIKPPSLSYSVCVFLIEEDGEYFRCGFLPRDAALASVGMKEEVDNGTELIHVFDP